MLSSSRLGCQVGTASIGSTAGAFTGNLYARPRAGHRRGRDRVRTGRPTAVQPVHRRLGKSERAGRAQPDHDVPERPVGAQITGFTANFTTLNGQAFTRLPSSCSTATSTFSATYYGATPTGSASGSFTPTGCANLPYAPVLTASETKDAKDNGATLVFTITQAATEAASKTIALNLPSGLGVNLSADVLCLTGSGPGCTVGTATATSPLIPSAALSNGTITLGGSATAPTITIAFPAFGITLVGDVSLASGTVTINNVPDVPLTALDLSITGPSGQKAFTTSCTPSSTTGTFTSQSGVTTNVTSAVTLINCAAKPTASGSASGLAAGNPKLRLKATHGKGGPNIASVAVALPSGLRFSRSAFQTHKTCVTRNGKKKCTTTTLIKGLGVSGAKVKTVALKAGKLVITLSKAAGSVTISLNGPVVTESKALQSSVKKHKTRSLTVTLKVTDANHTPVGIPRGLRLTRALRLQEASAAHRPPAPRSFRRCRRAGRSGRECRGPDAAASHPARSRC